MTGTRHDPLDALTVARLPACGWDPACRRPGAYRVTSACCRTTSTVCGRHRALVLRWLTDDDYDVACGACDATVTRRDVTVTAL